MNATIRLRIIIGAGYLVCVGVGAWTIKNRPLPATPYAAARDLALNHRFAADDVIARRSFMQSEDADAAGFAGRYAVRPIAAGTALAAADAAPQPALNASAARSIVWIPLAGAGPEAPVVDAGSIVDVCPVDPKRPCLAALPVAAVACDRSSKSCAAGVVTPDARRRELAALAAPQIFVVHTGSAR